jgi:hypothetical protein
VHEAIEQFIAFRKGKTLAAAGRQGCIKLHFRGRGQLVPGCVGLSLQGQAVPAPVRKGFEMALDAAVAGRRP